MWHVTSHARISVIADSYCLLLLPEPHSRLQSTNTNEERDSKL